MRRRGRNVKKNFKRPNRYTPYKLSAGGYTNRENPRVTGIEPHKFVTFRYAENISTSLTTGVGSNQVFRLNSIFDPNAAVGGTQPYQYDMFATAYNRYRVLRCGWKVTFAAAAAGYQAVVGPVNGSIAVNVSDLVTLTAACMLPYATYVVYNLGAMPKTVTGRQPLNKINGTSLVEFLADDRFEAQIGANPAEVLSLNIGVYNPTGSTITVSYFVELWYYVDLHDIQSQAPSSFLKARYDKLKILDSELYRISLEKLGAEHPEWFAEDSEKALVPATPQIEVAITSL